MKNTVIQLSTQTPIAVGKTRFVYAFPNKPNLLIKVHRRNPNEDLSTPFKRWFANAEDKFVFMTGYMRELSIYLSARYGELDPMVKYIAPLGGFVDTDLGIGLVVTAIRDKDGELAPTLGQLFKSNQLTPERIEMLNRFLDAMQQSDLVMGDMNFENLVLEQNEDGSEHFYLIDGLGERTFIPIQSLLRYARKKRKQAFVLKVRKRLAALN